MRLAPRLITTVLLVFFLCQSCWQVAWASPLTGSSDTLSNDRIGATSSHTVQFTTGSSGTLNLQQIAFQFATTSGGSTKPAGLDLSGATLGTVSANLGTGWSLDVSGAASGKLSITQSSPVSLSFPFTGSVQLAGIVNNSSIDTCLTGTGTLTDTCYVRITLYSDSGNTVLDSGSATYTVVEDPSMRLDVFPVSANTTTNGIQTDLASTDHSVSFGTVAPDQVRYVAQQIKVTTNAPHGYTVYAYLADPIRGARFTTDISPFGAVDATWATPQAWTTPSGTTPGSNTGWLGANTTDTRVTPGWSGNTQAKFGPMSTTKHVVAYSSSADRSGTTITVSYALGVNAAQAADNYTGNIIYEVEATY